MSSTPYYPNIPQPTDNPSNSQGQLLSNFQALDTVWARNHVELSDTTNNGRHTVIECKEQASDPTPLSGYGDIYVKDDTGTQNLYFQDDAGTKFQLNFGGSHTSNGYIVFGSTTFQWGSETSTKSVTYSIAFSGSAYSILVTQFTPSFLQFSVNLSSVTGFTLNTTANADFNFYWFAIGPT